MNLRKKIKVVASNKIKPKIMSTTFFLVFPLTPNDDKNEFGSSKGDKKKRIPGAAVPVEVNVENLLALTE